MTAAPGRIDIHAHSVPKPYRDVLTAASGGKREPPGWSPEEALDAMERDGIGAAITSIAASWTFLSGNEVVTLARRCNDFSAELIARWPSRFGAFAAVPVSDVNAACSELRYTFETLKLDGVGLFSNYAGKHLGDPIFDPILQMLNDYEATVFIHPTDTEANQRIQLRVPPPLLEFAFDTTRLGVSLLVSGALDRYPKVKFILAHAGGTLPFLSWRISHLLARHFSNPPFTEHFPMPLLQHNAGEVTSEFVMTRLRRFWYDTALSPDAETFGCLRAFADPERILFGTDWPYAPDTLVKDSIDSLCAPNFLGNDERTRIERNNALKLFPRLNDPAS
jgi:6-methylsalicylate decarboxylase